MIALTQIRLIEITHTDRSFYPTAGVGQILKHDFARLVPNIWLYTILTSNSLLKLMSRKAQTWFYINFTIQAREVQAQQS